MSTVQDLMGSGMSAQLAGRLGNSPKTYPGNGTTQTTATVIRGQALNLLAPTGSDTAFVLSSTFSTGRPVFVWNLSGSDTALVFPPLGGAFDGGTVNAALSIAPNVGGILQLVDGSGTPAEEWFSLINGSRGGSGLPPGGYLDQALTNAGSSGAGQWGNTVYARSGAPGTVTSGAALSLNGEQGYTTGDVGYGASVSLAGGRGDTGDGSYGGNGRLAGGSVGSQYGGYIQASGANSYNPGGLYLAGGSGGVYGGTITLAPGTGGTASGDLELLNLPTAVAGLPTGAAWIEPGTGALIVAPGTGTGGGGGAAIEPESGLGIKISAMTAAATAMNTGDVIPGLQGGVNVKFTQEQILTGGTFTGDDVIYGVPLTIQGGTGGPAGTSGRVFIYAGDSHDATCLPGSLFLRGGTAFAGDYNGGSLTVTSGYGYGNGAGGDALIYGGIGGLTGRGGNIGVRGGYGGATSGAGGDMTIGPGLGYGGSPNGQLLLAAIPTIDPALSDAIWNSNGVPMFSGVTNYSGTTTITGIGTKTITIVNGIITGIA